MNKRYKLSIALLGLITLALLFELFKDTFTQEGDFRGYVLVGNLTMSGDNIYNEPSINTWPPFFSIVSVPIAIIDNFSKYLVRFIWLALSIFAMALIMKHTVKFTIGRKLVFFPIKYTEGITQSKISIAHWAALIPLLLIFRYLLANLANIQINIFMLYFAIISIYYFSKNKDIIAALILAFSISIKVYPIFLLLYFVVKREFKIVAYTILFSLIFGIIPFFVFGIEQTIDYYSFWYNNTVANFASVGHKNQSFFSMTRSLLMHESPGTNQPLNEEIYLNILNLTIEQVKIVSYGIVALAGSVVVYIFRKKITERNSLMSFIEYAFILNLIPILSPLAWKAYFIFLFPSYFLNYLFIYQYKNTLKKWVNNYVVISYYLSVILTIFSSELFLGKYLSDVFEAFSCITIGTILIAINLLIFYSKFNKFNRRLTSN